MTIVAPYRDRSDHLQQFIPHIRGYLPDAKIVVVEQADTKPFNRAKLLNIGVLEYPDDYYAFHDVDKLPVAANYTYPNRPRQIAPSEHQKDGYFGGATLFNHQDFTFIDGFNNNFWGWGGEDNELMFQCVRKGLKAEWDIGTFIDLPHPRPAREFDAAKWAQAKRKRGADDGLANTSYKVVKRLKETGKDWYTQIYV